MHNFGLSIEGLTKLRSKYFIHEIATMYNTTNWKIWYLCQKFNVFAHPPRERLSEACAKNHADINGIKNPFYGKQHSEQARNIISQKAKDRHAHSPRVGFHLSEETKHKLSVSHKGRVSGFKGKHLSPESKAKLSESRRKPLPDNHVIELYNIGLSCREIGEQFGVGQGCIVGRLKLLNIPRRKSTCKLHSEDAKRKCRIACQAKPNKAEARFELLCSKYKLPFKYVGSGDVWLGTRNPDFINCNGKKQVVEIFGRYWHETSKYHNVPDNRGIKATIRDYKKYGFECIVIWEEELENESLVLERIK